MNGYQRAQTIHIFLNGYRRAQIIQILLQRYIRAQDIPTNIRERRKPMKRPNPAHQIHFHRILHQVTLHLHHRLPCKSPPVLFSDRPHPPHTLHALRPVEALFFHRPSGMLRPQRFPVPIYLPAGRLPVLPQAMPPLKPSHRDLTVAGALHRPLIDVRRPDDDVLVVDDHPFRVDIDHEPPAPLALFLRGIRRSCGGGRIRRACFAVSEAEEVEVVGAQVVVGVPAVG
ncbi:unnamed protein product [Linum tenue]|uniref:Uncharacterized protein n=1 Tax=Linum tenue TaxID=586396 RepID=A0AAV0ISD0_9ROSI|nr:unnamed protein product [Linum tenue]